MHRDWRQKKIISRQKHMLATIECLGDHSGAPSPQGRLRVRETSAWHSADRGQKLFYVIVRN